MGAEGPGSPLEPVDHVVDQGVGDAGEGLLRHEDGLSQLIQGHGVPVDLLLTCLQLGNGGRVGGAGPQGIWVS